MADERPTAAITGSEREEADYIVLNALRVLLEAAVKAAAGPAKERVVSTVPLVCRAHQGGDNPCRKPATRIRFFRDGEAATYCDDHQELAKRAEYGAIGEARLVYGEGGDGR